MSLSFNKSTDSKHKIKLESSLISAAWLSSNAPVGGTVSLEVITEFVGNGAPIKITGRSENGKKLGAISGVVRNNVYAGRLDIPDGLEIGDRVYFEASLPKNGLSGESDRIPVVPRVQVNNLKWSADEARRGDLLTLTAFVDGVPDETEAVLTIYEHDRDTADDKIVELPTVVKNGRLEAKWEYEYHEDTDEIPTQEEMEKYGKSYNPPEYYFTVKVGDDEFGRERESGLLVFKDWVEFQLTDADGSPIGNERYVLHLADGTKKEGKLDNEGKVRIDNVPPGGVEIEYPDLNEEYEIE